ncbi:MAG TPA: hypothetical protein EYQ86_04880 [Bacteroidetes bacterium]|nr:hypothetical protein [Bacteroidota bacterium]
MPDKFFSILLINSFQFIRKHGQWWPSSELSPTHIFTESLKYDQQSVLSGGARKDNAFSVRCVKD